MTVCDVKGALVSTNPRRIITQLCTSLSPAGFSFCSLFQLTVFVF